MSNVTKDQIVSLVNLQQIEIEIRSVKMKIGDELFLFTDCIEESRNKYEEEYGKSRVLNACDNATGNSSGELLNSIMNKFFEFLGDENICDDLTCIMVRRK